MKIIHNGKEIQCYELGKYYAYSDESVVKNYSNITSYDVFKQFNKNSFARIDYIKDTKTLIILLFRKDTSKKFLKYLLNEISKEREIKEIIYQNKCFDIIEKVLL